MPKYNVKLVIASDSDESKRFELANRKEWNGEAKDAKEAITNWKSFNGLDGIGIEVGVNPHPWPVVATEIKEEVAKPKSASHFDVTEPKAK